MYSISTSHPLPPNTRVNLRGKYRASCRQATLGQLGVRHSFFLPTTMPSASGLLHWGKARFPEREFVARTVKEDGTLGVRIWRTK